MDYMAILQVMISILLFREQEKQFVMVKKSCLLQEIVMFVKRVRSTVLSIRVTRIWFC